MERINLLKNIINRMNVYYKGQIISDELIAKETINFLYKSIESDEHSIAFLLHNGLIAYKVLSFSIMVIANLVLDEKTSEDVINDIEIGTPVEYRKGSTTVKRIFMGPYMDNGELRYKLQIGDTNNFDSISAKSINRLTPYYGTSTSLSSQGIGKKISKRVQFLKDVANLKEEEISSIPGMSTVIYMREIELDDILSNTDIRIDGYSFSILELARVSFYTANNEHRKAGNSSNNEPAIKVSYDIDKIKELVSSREGNEVLGFVSMDSDIYIRYASDFEKLLKKRKISYSWLISKYEYSEWMDGFLDSENKSLSILPLIKGFIPEEFSKHIKMNSFSIDMANTLCIEKNKTITYQIVDENIKYDDYRRIKNCIKFIIHNSFEQNEIINFSRWAFHMLKFYNNSFFSMEEYENSIAFSKGSLFNRILEYKEKVYQFPLIIRDKAIEVVDYIEKVYESLKESNNKMHAIKEYIWKGEYKRVLFVVASNLFIDILDKYVKNNIHNKRFSYHIITESELESIEAKQAFDLVLYTSLMNIDHYNPYNYVIAKTNIIFMFESQENIFLRLKKNNNEYVKKISKFAGDYEYNNNDDFRLMNEDDYYLDKEFKNYFVETFVQSERYQSEKEYNSKYELEEGLEAYKYGMFTDGDQIIFTRYFIAYVIDRENGVTSKKVDELKPGNEIIFTINNNETKDIVDDLLKMVCDANKEIESEYKLTLMWKEGLREFKRLKQFTYADIKKAFNNVGKDTTEQTIRSWMDSGSHIVGPITVENYMYIGKVISNQDMIDHPEKYNGAASVVRKTRVRLLDIIKRAYFYEGETLKDKDSFLTPDMIDKIKKNTVIKKLEILKDVEKFRVAIGRANVPISI